MGKNLRKVGVWDMNTVKSQIEFEVVEERVREDASTLLKNLTL